MNRRTLIATLLCSALITSCNKVSTLRADADKAVKEFHNSFNNKKYSGIYSRGNPEFKAAITEADFVSLLDAIQSKLGKNLKSSEVSWKLNSLNGDTLIAVSMSTEFERGAAIENFNFSNAGGAMSLRGYNIK